MLRLGEIRHDNMIWSFAEALMAQFFEGEPRDELRYYLEATLRARSPRPAPGAREIAKGLISRSALGAHGDDPIGAFADRIDKIYRGAVTEDPAANADFVQTIFDYFGLYPGDPVHRGFLIAILADIYFNSPLQGRPKGTKAKKLIWTGTFLFQLGEALKRLEQRHPRASDAKLSKLLREKFHPQATAETLRKRLPAARRVYERQLSKINR